MCRALKVAGVMALVAGGWMPAGLHAQAAPAAGPAPAQARVADDIARGDSAYALRDAQAALPCFRRALATAAASVPPDTDLFEALWKASRTEVDLAEAMPRGRAMDSLLMAAQEHAEAAIRARPAAAEGHFALARAVGRRALSVGTMDRIRYAKVVRDEALAALSYDSTHAGALHVLGMWNAEIMRVNGFARMFARNFLGAQVFSLASWDEAQRLLEAAVRLDPHRIVHHLDLAGIYADRGETAKSREQYEWIASAPLLEPNDALYKRQAAERLREP